MEFSGHQNKTRVSWDPFHPDYFISGSFDKRIFMWDRKQKEPALEFLRNGGVKIKHVAHDPHNDHHFAVGDADGRVKVWDRRNNTCPVQDF